MVAGNSTGRRQTAAIVCVLALLAIGVVAVLRHQTAPPSSQQPEAEAVERLVTAATVADIAAVSERRVESTPQRQSPPQAQVEAAPIPAHFPAPLAEDVLPPTPPDGYSFVEVSPQEMSKAPIEAPAQPKPAPADKLDWLGAADAIDALARQATAAGRDWTFGWLRLAPEAAPADLRAALRRHGGELLGASGRLVRARLPGAEAPLRAIAELPAVRGIGAVPPASKAAASFLEEAHLAAEQTPVFITLMADDPDGGWRRELEQRGAVVGRFDAQLRVYEAAADFTALSAIAAADFVLAIEPVSAVAPAHSTAVPAMGADALRMREQAGTFSGVGGAAIPIGVLDTGLNISHPDVGALRGSICGANFDILDPASDRDLWVDFDGHGTHVTGTIAGNGLLQPALAGMAPAVRHLRIAKVLSPRGWGSGVAIGRGMSFLANPSRCGSDGPAAKPLIVNMSLASTSRAFEGRGFGERKLDAVVWTHRQLYVVAQANSGEFGFSNYGAAKNSLAVGAVADAGDIARFSSWGPTADGRLAPQVVATGVGLMSAQGDGAEGGYTAQSGTSMAAPSVAGVAALLLAASPAHREHPALARAQLMASAIKPDIWLDDPEAFALDNSGGPAALQNQYGLGKVSTHTAVLNRNREDGWVSGAAAVTLEDGEFGHQDIEVPAGARRLEVVLTWDEPPADTISASVLNDLDLWVDHRADCDGGRCGEYSSRSLVDNVEWVVVRDPPPGTYRLQVLGERIHGEAPRAALAWTVVRGATTPQLRVTAAQRRAYAEEKDLYTVDLTIAADAYIAAGATLRIDGVDELVVPGSSISRQDNADGPPYKRSEGRVIALGEIAAGERQKVSLTLRRSWGPASVRMHFIVGAWNALGDDAFVDVMPRGGEAPSEPLLEKPANDDFAHAAALAGAEGEQAVNPILATPEPGEPAYSGAVGRPLRSVWFHWEAPSAGFHQFGTDSSEARLEVFAGQTLTSLARLNPPSASAIVAARTGRRYWIRLTLPETPAWHIEEHLRDLVLRWSPLAGPPNDDFHSAAELAGAEGEASGSTLGATLEAGEFYGALGASVWHRWSAPSDGYWRFSVGHRSACLLAFTGEQLATLRLIAGHYAPLNDSRSRFGCWDQIAFVARAGREYRIAVFSRGAASGAFALGWERASRERSDNDFFAHAVALTGAESSIEMPELAGDLPTVEPDEPPETGVGTRWWVWTAPETAEFTWRIAHSSGYRPGGHQLTAWTGETLDGLRLAGTSVTPSGSDPALKFAARKGVRYHIAAGFPANALSTLAAWRPLALEWGRTPRNDDLRNAAAIDGQSGSTTGTIRFATIEPGEEGREAASVDSVWWRWQAPTTGAYQFETDDAARLLSVYSGGEAGEEGFASLQPVASTFDDENAMVNAEQDRHYFIRVGGERYVSGTNGPPQENLGEGFTLAWSVAASPAELAFASSSAGDRVFARDELRQPIPADGDALAERRSRALDAAVDRIDAESREPGASFAVLPAPIRPDALNTDPPAPPRPPAGYAFVPFHGKMAQAAHRSSESADAAASATELVRAAKAPTAKLVGITAELRSREILPVFITLTAGDPDGRRRRELERLGLVVGRFDPAVRAYAANIPSRLLDAVAEADFVQAIEPVRALAALSNTAAPGVGADVLRTLVTPGLFEGVTGAGTPVGVLDSGLNISHPDIHTGRSSICGASFRGHVADGDLWVDVPWHGTHVTGILAGNGRLNPSFAGVAPGVRHLRIVNSWHSAAGLLRGMDFLAAATGCGDDETAVVKPLVVNLSLGDMGLDWNARTIEERKLDAMVWGHRQLYVVPMINPFQWSTASRGLLGFSNLAAAKNSLTVGAVDEGGEIGPFSSRGPTGDGRLMPQLVALGMSVIAPAGFGRQDGYRAWSGSSMAAPVVSGVAALLLDAAPAHRQQPALVRARLMASAIKPMAWFDDAQAYPSDNTQGPGTLHHYYGLGKVSARTSVLDRNQPDGWTGGSATVTLGTGNYAFHDIEVPADASRLDVVLAWDEPPAEDAFSEPVSNDLDLWVDPGRTCADAACGAHSSRSRIDNVEWVTVRNPDPGVHRLKVVAERRHGGSPRAGLAWNIVRGAGTPQLDLAAAQQQISIRHDETFAIDLTATVDQYVATGARIRIECRRLDETGAPSACHGLELTQPEKSVDREDGTTHALGFERCDSNWGCGYSETGVEEVRSGATIPLGELAVDERQEVRLTLRADFHGSFRLHFLATAWNAQRASTAVEVHVADDGGAVPPAVTPPTNDDFATAAPLPQEAGERPFDLLLATAEAGEPRLDVSDDEFDARSLAPRPPPRSVWFSWTAPTTGYHRFETDGDVALDLFRGDRLTSLAKVASRRDNLTVSARRGVRYMLRVSATVGDFTPNTLRWRAGERPTNDNFEHARLLQGDWGSVAGNNQGATLQTREFVGPLAATVWYEWVALADGQWRFSTDAAALNVLVFTGDSLGTLRAVSEMPEPKATFAVREGRRYRIAVAAEDARSAGGSFVLRWIGMVDPEASDHNDHLRFAVPLQDGTEPASFYITSIGTTEPDEPLETGNRTRWWAWTAPEQRRYTRRSLPRSADGHPPVWNAPEQREYTWRIVPSSDDASAASLRLAAFTGSALDDLVLAGQANLRTASTPEMKFHATAGTRYWIAVGLNDGDAFRNYGHLAGPRRLEWGLSPANDDLANAAAIAGIEGSVSGNTAFATVEWNEPRRAAGRSSVWWAWRAQAEKWMRFDVDDGWSVEVYETTAEQPSALALVASNKIGPAIFLAAKGRRYIVRVGLVRVDADGEESATAHGFDLNWRESAPPPKLRYVGRIADGSRSGDRLVSMSPPWGLAFDTTGTTLFAGASDINVFARDPATGALTSRQRQPHDGAHTVFWDAHRSRLLATNNSGCDQPWRTYALTSAGTLSRKGDLPLDQCHSHLLTDASGIFLYAGCPSCEALEVFEISPDGNALDSVQTVRTAEIEDMAISADNAFIYVLSDNVLQVLARDQRTGSLAQTFKQEGFEGLRGLALSNQGRTLFAIGRDGSLESFAVVFDLRPDPGKPKLLGDSPLGPPVPAARPPGIYFDRLFRCRYSPLNLARAEAAAIDLFCDGSTLGFLWDADAGRLEGTDYQHWWKAELDGEELRDRGVAVVASPDGRHAYLAVNEYVSNGGQILIFERVNSHFSANARQDAHQRLPALSVTPAVVRLGAQQSNGCIGADGTTSDGVRREVITSKWQRRHGERAEWTDIQGTEATGTLCTHAPSEPGQYRLVAEVAINGAPGNYASNLFTH